MYNLEFLKKFALTKGGKCLSEKYINNETSYTWECENGHVFNMLWLTIKTRGGWCKECKNKNGIKSLQQFAEELGGKCLSEKFIRCDSKYKFICADNHEFTARWSQLKCGIIKWCKECNSNNINTLKSWALEKNGECLSEEYKTARDEYIWKCENNHEWKASWINMNNNMTYCKQCNAFTIKNVQDVAEKKLGKCLGLSSGKGVAGRYILQCKNKHVWITSGSNIVNGNNWCSQCLKLTIEEMKELAREKNGECISDTYINKRTKLIWKCSEGHIFKSTPGYVKHKGMWCLKCSIDRKRLDIIQAQNKAIEKGGKLLSTEYINLETPMEWQCKKGHIFKTCFKNIRGKSSWCPKCFYKSEEACREVFEKIFPFKFPKKRLKSLDYLELDGYSSELGIAFEYDGRQHSEYIPHFHRNGTKDFMEQQERDYKKEDLCIKNGIMLIRIPHTLSYDKPKDIEEFISSSLEEIGS
jgi:hypothetical protein